MPDETSAPAETSQNETVEQDVGEESQTPQSEAQEQDSSNSESEQPETDSSSNSEKQSARSPEDFEKEIAKLRKENASWRKKLRSKEQEQAEREKAAKLAEMTELEKLQAEKEELLQQLETFKQEREQLELKYTLADKVIDPEAAIKLLDREKHYDADGNLDLEQFFQSYPFLKPQEPEPQNQGGDDGGKTVTEDKPVPKMPSARNAAPPKRFTREAIQNMSPSEYEQNRAAILEAAAKGQLR